ncbi:hypothetical protein NEMIN01_0446 [Nematocida minor]|uniref:uncharacterized protein n=1 Tax=Nematocida minor TaxID=1912983 RepID=UPI00221FBA03|nr:uncharacterized protein NEMIN01_0446 [Nematocida minor]KAI5189383.1 hypothetical protein NEMIN01_0446 [Nematocida minor]
MEVSEELNKEYCNKLVELDSTSDKKYDLLSIASVPKESRTLLSSCDENTFKKRAELRVALSDLLAEQANFIRTTVEYISQMLDCSIYIEPELVQQSTHLLVSTRADGLCKRTYKYLLGLLFKKSIVTFLWYVDLFEVSRKINITKYSTCSFEAVIAQITVHNIVRGDSFYGVSDAPMLAHRNNQKTPILKGIDIYDANNVLSRTEKELIKKSGGVVNTGKVTKKSKVVNEINEFSDMIASGEILTMQKREIQNKRVEKAEKENSSKIC